MSTDGRRKVKVKYIVEQFVETDEARFKSVVQSLTGKDSPAATASAGRVEATAAGNEDRRSAPVAGSSAAQDKVLRIASDHSPTMDELFDLLCDN
ncbi:hypothetical protein AXF42_Ash001043 [Apostasia shenzhenica]|uniref:VQ domain-containing protein n=1 Tax=Apostasia shenzhenica TaxID=1088818 RepID=A0A2I0ATT4_9ASPA|nr:hypothetical protein AXF42_Ash001043 [Apostasia shenzhenica]